MGTRQEPASGDAAVAFYRDDLGFKVALRPAPSFAMLYLGSLRLLLSAPSTAHALPDGTLPGPGGWDRIELFEPVTSDDGEHQPEKGPR